MNQKKAKMIRKEINELHPNLPRVTYEFVGGNPDIEKRIASVGLQAVGDSLGYLPLTCKLTNKCTRYFYKKAKAI